MINPSLIWILGSCEQSDVRKIVTSVQEHIGHKQDRLKN